MLLIAGNSGAGETFMCRSIVSKLYTVRRWKVVMLVCPRGTYTNADNHPTWKSFVKPDQVLTGEHWTSDGRTLKKLMARIEAAVVEHRTRGMETLVIIDGESCVSQLALCDRLC